MPQASRGSRASGCPVQQTAEDTDEASSRGITRLLHRFTPFTAFTSEVYRGSGRRTSRADLFCNSVRLSGWRRFRPVDQRSLPLARRPAGRGRRRAAGRTPRSRPARPPGRAIAGPPGSVPGAGAPGPGLTRRRPARRPGPGGGGRDRRQFADRVLVPAGVQGGGERMVKRPFSARAARRPGSGTASSGTSTPPARRRLPGGGKPLSRPHPGVDQAKRRRDQGPPPHQSAQGFGRSTSSSRRARPVRVHPPLQAVRGRALALRRGHRDRAKDTEALYAGIEFERGTKENEELREFLAQHDAPVRERRQGSRSSRSR